MTPDDFDFAMSAAAHVAADASRMTMRRMAEGLIYDEDDVTGALVGELNASLRGMIGPLLWKAKIMRHRAGKAAEERAYGADLLLHIEYKDSVRKFSKGLLVQSKKVEPEVLISSGEQKRLHKQCDTMLTHTPAAYVFDYASSGLRVASANKVSGLSDRDLHSNCEWTAYRFFYEFFRCPVGDRRVTSTHIGGQPITGSSDKLVDDLPEVLKFEVVGME